jgi:signal peptidase I
VPLLAVLSPALAVKSPRSGVRCLRNVDTSPNAMRVLDRTQSRLPKPLRIGLDWLITLVVAITFVLIFETEVAKPYRIPSESMEPSLNCAAPGPGCLGSSDDRVIALRLAYDFESPSRGQMVVFVAPPRASTCGAHDGGTTFVKRLIALPGDNVRETDGHVYVNGRLLHDPYVAPANRDHRSGHWHVGRGQYFFLGDNRANSCDSRDWGTVPRSSLIGPVVLRYWPITRIGFP